MQTLRGPWDPRGWRKRKRLGAPGHGQWLPRGSVTMSTKTLEPCPFSHGFQSSEKWPSWCLGDRQLPSTIFATKESTYLGTTNWQEPLSLDITVSPLVEPISQEELRWSHNCPPWKAAQLPGRKLLQSGPAGLLPSTLGQEAMLNMSKEIAKGKMGTQSLSCHQLYMHTWPQAPPLH